MRACRLIQKAGPGPEEKRTVLRAQRLHFWNSNSKSPELCNDAKMSDILFEEGMKKIGHDEVGTQFTL